MTEPSAPGVIPGVDMRDEIRELRTRLRALEQQQQEYLGPLIEDPPVLPYRTIIKNSFDPGYTNRILVGTPTTGLVRMEWVAGRYGQIIPTNWSYVAMNQWMAGYIALGYQVADAQNLIVKDVIEREFEWLLLLEHDTIPPPYAFLMFNEYLQERQVPVVSGLYYTRSRPAEPLIYRGRGTSYFRDFKIGDKVWCDGLPTGCLLIHGGILRAMWAESAEYQIKHADGRVDVTRKVFDTPRKAWYDPETGQFNALGGTSDLEWCTRLKTEGFFAKAGWPQYQDMEYPLLCDTRIFCQHIDKDGTIYP